MVIRRPMGVCAAITPYNFPLTLLGTKVAPALASGNTVVAKPAATTPLATLEVARLFAEAGVPDGVLNVVTGRGATIGDALVGHPDVRRVAFTGSTAVGRHIMSIAGPALKRVTLELGGSDPVIVCADADVDAAVKAVIIGRYWNAGQACLGCKRVFVADAVYDDFAGQLVDRVGALRARRRHGQGREAAAADGPDPHARGPRRAASSSSRTAWPRAASCSSAAAPAATTRATSWSRRSSPSRAPTRAWSARRSSAPCCRSSASPTSTRRSRAPTTRPYGLGSSIWTHDVRNIHRAAHEIDAGMTWVNQIHYGYDELPFGGIKDSGLRQGARAGGARLLRRAQVGGRRRARLMAVTFAADGAVGTITLDNPPANSYDIDMMRELAAAVDAGGRRRAARVVIVRSASEKFFCAGADIKAFLANDVDANMEMIRAAHDGARAHRRAPTGLHRLDRRPRARRRAGDRAGLRPALRAPRASYQLGTPEVTLGLLPGNGGTQRLPRLIGRGPALELLLTGRAGHARRGADAGPRRPRSSPTRRRSTSTSQRLAAGPPLAIAAIKRCVHEGGELPLDDGLALERGAHRAAVPLQGRDRGPDRVRREARRRSSWAHEHAPHSGLERGAFLDGAVEPIGDDALTITDPATAPSSGA